jgi:hypothetical protein
VEFDERSLTAKPFKYLISHRMSCLIRKYRLVGRVWILAKVGNKAVLLGVKVDVAHQCRKVGVGPDRNTAKAFLEQAAGATVGFVDGLGVAVEKVGELLGWRLGRPARSWILDTHQQVKMVAQQDIGERIGDGGDVFGV